MQDYNTFSLQGSEIIEGIVTSPTGLFMGAPGLETVFVQHGDEPTDLSTWPFMDGPKVVRAKLTKNRLRQKCFARAGRDSADAVILRVCARELNLGFGVFAKGLDFNAGAEGYQEPFAQAGRPQIATERDQLFRLYDEQSLLVGDQYGSIGRVHVVKGRPVLKRAAPERVIRYLVWYANSVDRTRNPKAIGWVHESLVALGAPGQAEQVIAIGQ